MPAVAPSESEVNAVATLAEPVFRNLNITLSYARLSQAFAEWCPGGANWCTFATWASRQAGCTIRREDLGRAVAARLQRRLEKRPLLRDVKRVFGLPADRLSPIVGELFEWLPGTDRAASAVARGNLKVFEEIGREFARFLAHAGEGEEAFQTFLTGFRSGPPPEGQDLLRRSFISYAAARTAADPGLRAQLLLLANVQIGLHEQTRLQPEIREAMDAALLDVADTRRRLLERLERVVAAGSLGAVHSGLGGRLLNHLADELSAELRAVARLVVTERLMTIALPAVAGCNWDPTSQGHSRRPCRC